MLDDINPTPAYVMGRRWDCLAWNKAADGIFAISEASSPYALNLVWRLFTSPTRWERPHWEQMARGVLAEFRTASARYPGDSWFEELIEDLKQVSPEFCRWWPHHDASGSLDHHKEMSHSTLGHLEFEHIILQIPSDPDVRVMIYTPLGETGEKLERFRETMAFPST
jgi:hypothetical protein